MARSFTWCQNNRESSFRFRSGTDQHHPSVPRPLKGIEKKTHRLNRDWARYDTNLPRANFHSLQEVLWHRQVDTHQVWCCTRVTRKLNICFKSNSFFHKSWIVILSNFLVILRSLYLFQQSRMFPSLGCRFHRRHNLFIVATSRVCGGNVRKVFLANPNLRAGFPPSGWDMRWMLPPPPPQTPSELQQCSSSKRKRSPQCVKPAMCDRNSPRTYLGRPRARITTRSPWLSTGPFKGLESPIGGFTEIRVRHVWA